MSAPSPRLSRRRIVRGALAATIAGGALDAFALEPRWLDVTRHWVDVPDLPGELEGFTVAHLTDVHLTSIGRLHRAVAAALAAERPDLVALTGDVIDGDAHLPALAELLSMLRASGAELVATLGNWEHWGGVDLAALEATYTKAGARLLVNDAAPVRRGLVVVGTDDGCTGRASLPRAFRDAPAGRPRLLLSHAPGLFEGRLDGAEAALSLAGHTHGGQVRALTKAVVLPPGSGPFAAGPYTTAAGPLYVNRGAGTSVVPARFCCRPELALFRLRAGSQPGITPG